MATHTTIAKLVNVVLLLGGIGLLWLLRYGCRAMVDYIKKTVTHRTQKDI